MPTHTLRLRTTPDDQAISAAQVQIDAQAHVNDHSPAGANRLMRMLASIRGQGRYRQNDERDLCRIALLENMTVPLDMYWIWLDMKDPIMPDRIKRVQHPLLLPHELFAVLHRQGLLQATMFPQGAASLDTWWQFVAGQPWARTFPKTDRERAHCVPLGLFGDDAPYVKSDVMLMFAW
jgi:hypothetical protein